MPWQTEHHAEAGVIHTTYTGQVPPQELGAAVAAAVGLAARHGTHLFLTDLRQLEGGHSVFDLYALAETLHALPIPLHAREALLLPTSRRAAGDADFWETVCRNRGYEVRGFADPATALAWLREAPRVPPPRVTPVASALPSG
ncbi:MAG: hypothetical protein AB7I01_12755 [Gammaproteobacteria bacterium]